MQVNEQNSAIWSTQIWCCQKIYSISLTVVTNALERHISLCNNNVLTKPLLKKFSYTYIFLLRVYYWKPLSIPLVKYLQGMIDVNRPKYNVRHVITLFIQYPVFYLWQANNTHVSFQWVSRLFKSLDTEFSIQDRYHGTFIYFIHGFHFSIQTSLWGKRHEAIKIPRAHKIMPKLCSKVMPMC